MPINLGALTLPDPSGPAWPVMGVLYLYLLHSISSIIGCCVLCYVHGMTQEREQYIYIGPC
jgi:hypothetical protein